MAIKSADQISIVDLTDGYSVTLTSDGYTLGYHLKCNTPKKRRQHGTALVECE